MVSGWLGDGMTCKWMVSFGLLLSVAAGAQTVGGNKPAGGGDVTYTMSVKSQLVVETVVVKDKSGKPVDGLTAKDFVVTEDGIAETVRFAEHQVLPTGPEARFRRRPKSRSRSTSGWAGRRWRPSVRARQSTRIAACSPCIST